MATSDQQHTRTHTHTLVCVCVTGFWWATVVVRGVRAKTKPAYSVWWAIMWLCRQTAAQISLTELNNRFLLIVSPFTFQKGVLSLKYLFIIPNRKKRFWRPADATLPGCAERTSLSDYLCLSKTERKGLTLWILVKFNFFVCQWAEQQAEDDGKWNNKAQWKSGEKNVTGRKKTHGTIISLVNTAG